MTTYERTTINHAETALRADVNAAWKQHAACRGRSAVMDDEHTKPGLAICRACPVEAVCVRWVMSLPETQDPGGVCGGTTQHNRKLLRLKANRR